MSFLSLSPKLSYNLRYSQYQVTGRRAPSSGAGAELLRTSRTLLRSLSPYLIPAGYLTITVYSRLVISSLQMVPYHGTPPLLPIDEQKQ